MAKKKSKANNEDNNKSTARIALDSTVSCSTVIKEYTQNCGDLDVVGLLANLHSKQRKLKKDDLEDVEDMLFDQANALQAIFSRMARVAIQANFVQHVETYLRLALKAQAQCSRTLATLHAIKYPSNTSFIKQTNIGENVQINNNSVPVIVPDRGFQEKILKSSNKLLEEPQNGTRLDLRTAQETIGSYPHLETVR